jgi:hypothetical protein
VIDILLIFGIKSFLQLTTRTSAADLPFGRQDQAVDSITVDGGNGSVEGAAN